MNEEEEVSNLKVLLADALELVRPATAMPGSLTVATSSIRRQANKQCLTSPGERGILCLAAPVSGGEVGAKAGYDVGENVKAAFC